MMTFVLLLIFGAILWAALQLGTIAELLYYILQELKKHNRKS